MAKLMTAEVDGHGSATAIGPVTDGGDSPQAPYGVFVTIQGVADLLLHAYNPEAVGIKSGAAKGSKAKKSDALESYVYRTTENTIAIPCVYLVASLREAGRYRQDPRSPRKSMSDLLRASVVPLAVLADTQLQAWDYIDQRRVVVQRSAITRERPALRAGWSATFHLMVTTPEYIPPALLNELIGQAGRLVGIGDFRPIYGRYQVTRFEPQTLT